MYRYTYTTPSVTDAELAFILPGLMLGALFGLIIGFVINFVLTHKVFRKGRLSRLGRHRPLL